MAKNLTKPRLEAIIEALTLRLAGELDAPDISKRAYAGALDWAEEELDRREAPPKFHRSK
jgi:hypothetical protein